MANFGKKAKLESQKGTVKVECLVTVYDEILGDDGKPARYRVVVQRLQDGVAMSDAIKGLADPMPYITNKKQWLYDAEGNSRVRYTHYDYISPEMMEAVRNASKNVYESVVTEDDGEGGTHEKTVQNYCVRLDIGFNPARGEAFFYRIKAGVNKDSLAKDIKYNLRHMPAEGRALTAEILKGHRDVTDVAARVYRDAQALGKGGGTDG